jgi:hypothetical protein
MREDHEIISLNDDDLDTSELEQRLEMTAAQDWICGAHSEN